MAHAAAQAATAKDLAASASVDWKAIHSAIRWQKTSEIGGMVKKAVEGKGYPPTAMPPPPPLLPQNAIVAQPSPTSRWFQNACGRTETVKILDSRDGATRGKGLSRAITRTAPHTTFGTPPLSLIPAWRRANHSACRCVCERYERRPFPYRNVHTPQPRRPQQRRRRSSIVRERVGARCSQALVASHAISTSTPTSLPNIRRAVAYDGFTHRPMPPSARKPKKPQPPPKKTPTPSPQRTASTLATATTRFTSRPRTAGLTLSRS